MLSNISEYELAKIFIYSKQEKIKKVLNFDKFDTFAAVEILYKFIVDHRNTVWTDNTNKYAPLFDEIFFAQAIDVLKTAHTNGVNLNKCPSGHEPAVRFVA